MTSNERPLEDSPEVAAAAEDETTVPQLMTGGGRDADTPDFQEPTEAAGPGPRAEAATPAVRTGAEQPWEPEDLAVAQGHDPTPRNVERARRELAEEGPAAIEKTVP